MLSLLCATNLVTNRSAYSLRPGSHMLKDSLATSLSSVSTFYVSITSTTVGLAGTWLGRQSFVQAHPQDKENVLAMSDLVRKLPYQNGLLSYRGPAKSRELNN